MGVRRTGRGGPRAGAGRPRGSGQAADVRRNRVVVAYEDNRSWGWGAEISARIGDELFEHLDAPVKRVGALDTFVGYAPPLEDAILPQIDDIADACREVAGY